MSLVKPVRVVPIHMAKKLSVAALALMSFVTTNPNLAKAGTKDSGGDPMAQQFVDLGEQLSAYFIENPYKTDLPFAATKFQDAVNRLQSSLNDEKETHLVEFTAAVLHDSNGVEKPAVFSSDGHIRVNRAAWVSYSQDQKLVQVALEVGGLIGIPARYETIERLVHGHADLIESAPLPGAINRYQKSGWKLVGQDPGWFSDVNTDDTLIDGGILGSGSSLNQRFIQFLGNPWGDAEWSSKIVTAFNAGKPTFFVTHTPNGDRASVTMLYLADAGADLESMVAYSLFFEKTKNDYLGDCSGDAPRLTAFARLKQCYLNLDIYYARESLVQENFLKPGPAVKGAVMVSSLLEAGKSVFAQLYKELEASYSKNPDIMRLALQNAYITDYEAVVDDEKDRKSVLEASLKAAGFSPDLRGTNLNVSPFWSKRVNKSRAKAVRLYKSAKALAEQRLLYNNPNVSCSADLQFKLGLRPGSLVDQDYGRAIIKNGQCTNLRMGLGPLDERLFDAMVAYGFIYDPKSTTWSLQSKKPHAKGGKL